MLSWRTLCEASAIRFARIWACVSQFMRSIARRMYSARESRSACAHLLLVSIRSSGSLSEIAPMISLSDIYREYLNKISSLGLSVNWSMPAGWRRQNEAYVSSRQCESLSRVDVASYLVAIAYNRVGLIRPTTLAT